MGKPNQPLEWILVEEQENPSAWPPPVDQAAVDEPDAGTAEPIAHNRKPHYLYELLIGIAAVYGLALALLWQQAERRITALEQQIDLLHNELVQQGPPAGEVRGGQAEATADALTTLPHHLETTHLHFASTPELAALVQRVAEGVDAAYRQLRQQLRLPPIPAAGKLTIVIDPEAVHALRCGGERCVEGRTDDAQILTVPAPATAAALYKISEADALANEITVRLSKRTLTDALRRRRTKVPWKPLMEGLYFYLAREIRSPQWQQEDVYLTRRWLAQRQSLDLVHPPLVTPVMTAEGWTSQAPIADEIADPLIEFILETYGYEILPALFDGFTQHTEWESLAPAVFGVTAAELETEWHAYLAERYPAE